MIHIKENKTKVNILYLEESEDKNKIKELILHVIEDKQIFFIYIKGKDLDIESLSKIQSLVKIKGVNNLSIISKKKKKNATKKAK